jgi:hypothetical protein
LDGDLRGQRDRQHLGLRDRQGRRLTALNADGLIQNDGGLVQLPGCRTSAPASWLGSPLAELVGTASA